MSSTNSEQHDSLEVDVNVDINHIHDEEVLRKLWQVTEDFAEKRRIRARMYKLREKRLKEFYMSEDVVGDARCDSPMMMMMESCEMSMSSSFQTQSTFGETRETSSNADGAQESVDDVDRKSSAEQKRKHDVHDDVVSEKIRKKTSERTERYQKILHEIEHATEFRGDDGEEATRAEDSPFVPVQVMERTQTSASSDSCVVSSNIDKPINEAVNVSLVASVAEIAGEVVDEVNVDECTSFIEELQKRVSRREKFDGDYKIIIETTETLRRIRTSEQENPVTQKVTVTRTVKQHVNGSILEDDQDEIIEDIDDKVVDEKFHAKKAFECSDKPTIENIDTEDRSNKSITNDIDSNVEIMELDIESQVVSDKDKTIDYSVTTPESMNSPRIDLQRNHSVDIEDVTENDDDVEKPGEKKLPGKTSAVSRTLKTTKSTTLTTSKTSRTVEVSAREDKKSQIPKFSTPKTTPTTKRVEKSSSGTSKASPAKSKNDTLDTSEVADESVDEFLKLERELEASTSVEEQHPLSKPTPSTPTTSSNRTASLKSSSRLVTKSTTSPLPVRQASTASTASKKTLDKTPVKKTEVSRTETPKSGIPRAAGTSSSTPKEKVTRSLSSGKSRSEANNNDDKPWRANSKLKQPETKTKGDVPKTPTKEPVRKISPPISRKKSAESPRFEEVREPHKPLEQEPEEEIVPDVEVNGNANLEQEEVENFPQPKEEEEREDDIREEEEEEEMIEVSINDNNRFQSIDETTSNLSGPEQSEPNTPSGPERTKLNLALRETSKSPVKDVDNTRAKLTASPALDSPSVVMKARSLFDTSESRPKSPEIRPKSPETRQKQQTSTSKIRSVFEVSSKISEPVKTKESPSPVAKLSDQAKNRFSPKTGEKAVGKLRNPFEKKDPDSSPSVALCPADEMPRTASSQETGTLFTADNTGNNGDDNEELVMLENMLNAATSYDERSRIRAQIRVVKKKLGLLTGTGTGSATSSPMLSRRSVASSEPPANAENLPESSRKVSDTLPAKEQPIERQERVVAPPPAKEQPIERQEQVAAPSPAKEEPIERQEPVVAPPRAKEEPIDKQERKVSFSETTVTMKTETFVEQTESSSVPWRRSTSRETSPEKQVPWRRSAEREMVPAEPTDTPDAPGTPGTPGTDQNQTPWRNSKPKPLTTQVSQSKLNFPRLPEYDSSQPDMADTLDITSSYGTGPMDENGRPLFGLGALRRKPKTSSPREPNPESPFTPTETRAFPEAEKEHAPIIESRSQPLNELQKLHEQQIQPKESPVLQVEKPRAKLRDSFTNSKMDAPEDEDTSPGEREPIIMERSQALRDIIRRHEKVTTEPAVPNDPLPSPKPKAKLKDTFFSADSSTTEESREERKIIERSENFQNIVKRHQDLSSEPESIGPQHSPVPASPIKRPGILKKPKDWSSPSPQEIPSPIKESPRKTSIEVKLEPVTPFQKEASPVPEPPKSVEIPFKLTGESTGHTVRSTSTFQLQLSGSTTERTVPDEPVSSSRPWNRKPSVPEETQNVPGSSSRPWMRKTSKPEENQDVPEQSNRKTSNPLPFHNVPEQSNRKISNPEPFQNVPEQSNRKISNPEPFQNVPAEPKVTRSWERKPADVPEQRSRRSEDVLRSTVQVQLSSTSVTPQSVPVTTQPNPAEPEDPTPWRRRSIPREPSLPKETIPATQTFVQSEEINVSTARGRERSPLPATPQQGIRVTSTFATYSTQTTPRTEVSPERTRTTPSFLNRDRDTTSPDQGIRVSSTSSTYRTQTTPRTEVSPERTRATPSFLNRDRDTATPDQGIRVTSTSSTYRTHTTARTEVSPERTPRSTAFPTRDTREPSPATATPDQGIRVSSTSSTYRIQTTSRTEVSPERTVRSTAFPNRDTREPSPATATPDQGIRISSTPRSYGNTPRTEPSPDRVVRPSLAGSSVKALAQKFLSPDSGSATPKQNSQYPKAGLIFRSSSFRQNETSGGSSKGSFVQRSESLRSGGSLPRQRPSIEIRRSQDRESRESSPSYVQSVSMEVAVGTPVAPGTVNREPEGSPMTCAERKTSYQSSTTWTRDSRESSPSKVASVTLELTPRGEEKKFQDLGSPSKSFLEDRTPVRGMQDIIQRMRAGETNGHAPNNDDDHARSLLNKFLGAQILVQCTEPLVRSRTPDLVERVVTTTEHRNDDGHVIGRSITANQKGSRHEVSSTVDDQGRPWTTTTSTTAVAHKTVSTRIIQDDSTDAGGSTIVNGVDINICQDESKLRELLENCGDFETRRQIRARIKSLVEPKISSARTEESSSLSRSSFRSSSFRQSGPSSAFAKFQQLERNAKAAV